MSWFMIYLACGIVWAEMGLVGYCRRYNKMPTAGFYVFMIATWPYLLFCWLKDSDP